MLFAVPGFIDRYLDRFIDRDSAKRHGLGAPRGCAIVMPLALIIWFVIMLVGALLIR